MIDRGRLKLQRLMLFAAPIIKTVDLPVEYLDREARLLAAIRLNRSRSRPHSLFTPM